MRFARIGEIGREMPVVFHEERFYDLSPLTSDISGDFLVDGPARVKAALTAGELAEASAEGVRTGAPIPRPSAIYCVGMNYAAHAAESGAEPPKNLVLFMKAPNTLVGPYDAVAIPRGSEKTDWEVELGVVIGARASYLAGPEESAAHIAGYVVANDLSEREWQLELSGGQWGKGKSAPGFSPVGPWLVTPDEVDASDLRLRSSVNGEPRQDSRTSDLIFDVPYIIWHLSQFLTLEPGDLIMTGTPEGVALSGRFPYLRSGDVVELEIEGLGAQRQVMGAA
jgi:2-keto-4-pentenoate hydratase/2-oxohepta-3-ene-1,7-dioic acid hydratase in catechol pathway